MLVFEKLSEIIFLVPKKVTHFTTPHNVQIYGYILKSAHYREIICVFLKFAKFSS